MIMLDTKDVLIELKNKIDENTISAATISDPIKKGEGLASKVKVSAISLKGELMYQLSQYVGDKVYHKNVSPDTVIDNIVAIMENNFKQCEIKANIICTVLMNKKRQFTLTGVKKNDKTDIIPKGHNKEKNYILPEGEYVDWMYRLGLMDKKGRVLNQKQKKFRQINKFLEMLRDIENEIPENSTVIDMGCGKSYLTFAMYHYFNNIKNKHIHIEGYDLKRDVVDLCNSLAKEFGFSDLKFCCRDIADIENKDNKISMIITLHACDTATDHAIYNGIRWGCRVMMNVPCCQHELFWQMKNEDMDILLKHGIIKERFAALMTDSIRAEIIEIMGYKVQVMEFIDMEHTPKNIMLRSVRTGRKDNGEKLKKVERPMKEYNIEPTLYKLLFEKNQPGI